MPQYIDNHGYKNTLILSKGENPRHRKVHVPRPETAFSNHLREHSKVWPQVLSSRLVKYDKSRTDMSKSPGNTFQISFTCISINFNLKKVYLDINLALNCTISLDRWHGMYTALFFRWLFFCKKKKTQRRLHHFHVPSSVPCYQYNHQSHTNPYLQTLTSPHARLHRIPIHCWKKILIIHYTAGLHSMHHFITFTTWDYSYYGADISKNDNLPTYKEAPFPHSAVELTPTSPSSRPVPLIALMGKCNSIAAAVAPNAAYFFPSRKGPGRKRKDKEEVKKEKDEEGRGGKGGRKR